MTGRFISLEGPEGCGKSSQIAELSTHCQQLGYEIVKVRAPGGTPLGEYIRDALLHDVAGEPPCDRSEMMLFAAAHAQLADEVILPALEQGKVVIADRYTDSMVCYQGIARGFGKDALREIAWLATGNLWPHKTVLLDVSPEVGFARISSGTLDRMERAGKAFHQKVRAGFLELAADEPERWAIVNGELDIRVVTEHVWDAVEDLF